MNVVVLLGRLARPAEVRELPSGDRLVAYEVTVERPGERAETVPVVWLGAPANAVEHEVDERMLVVGRVRRRFFRAGGSTQSRTEVVAEAVVNAKHAKRAGAALERARARLAEDT
ncbi:MAG TPA: single-stranded DNA-binding protein [Acidimicrobiales bacterium]|jgi:single-strand DNA-binding protein|nr:single-stranded DNA-binding protein [Acidimicrobiales bacterium]